MQTVGIDVGYGFTKAVAVNQEPIIFPSLVGTAEDLDFDPGLASNGGMTIHINGRSYFVGDRAALQARVLTRTLDRSRVTSEEAKILFLAALTWLFPEGARNGKALVIGTGLPVDWFDRDAPLQREAWEGQHSVHMENGRTVRYDVKRVVPIPQAFGSLWREMFGLKDGRLILKDKDLVNGSVGIVDFGTLTVNLLSYNAGQYIQKECVSVETGMLSILEVAKRAILEKWNEELELHEVDQAIQRGYISLYGEKKSIRPLIEPVLRSTVTDVLRVVLSEWKKGRDKAYILVTGGGAYALGGLFKEMYGHPHIRIVPDSQVANAQGFLLWAHYISERETHPVPHLMREARDPEGLT